MQPDKIIIPQLQHIEDELLNTLQQLPADELNTIPFEGSWTAAQVADHILKAISGSGKLLHSPSRPVDRDPGEKVEAIKKLFLDYNIKMKSPDFILPTNKKLDREELIRDAKAKLVELGEAVSSVDLNTFFEKKFELPGFGELTRLELSYFFLYHTTRHVHQLKNIVTILENRR